MKRSANIEMLFAEAPFEARFELAKAAGFDAVEFAGWLDKDIGAIKQAARKAEIEIVAFTGDELYSPLDPLRQQAYIDLVTRSAKTAKELGARFLVTHSNALSPEGPVRNEYRELSDAAKLLTMFDTYQKLAPIMQEAGVTLLVEAVNPIAHPGVFMTHVDTAAAIVERVDCESVRLLCDIYHMQVYGGSLIDSLKKYRNLIGHIHFADVPGRHEPGTGEIDFQALCQTLQNIGYRGMVGFALEPRTNSAQAAKAIMSYHA